MTRHHQTDIGQSLTRPVRTPRLRLKAKAPQSGYVDGAWWPRTDDLPAELPDLLAVLSVRLGPIDRVLVKLDEWQEAPAKITLGGRAVRIDGYRYQPPGIVEVIGLNRHRIVLLLVPASTDPGDAHTTLMAAAAPNDATTVSDLLTHTPNRGAPPPDPAQQRWESEGGATRRPALAAQN